MNILIAPDKFKGSLSAKEVCDALAKGLKQGDSSISTMAKPLADGGDGSLAILDHYFDLETITCSVQDPLGRAVQASYLKNQDTAYIEMAAASGLVLLRPEERNPLLTSTYGTGQLIADAIEKGIEKIYLLIGGSATNDGGIGVASALGYRFYDVEGNFLEPIGKNLLEIEKIDNSQLRFDLSTLEVKIIVDVNNPFYGEKGAAHVYAKQKGANPTEIIHLDEGLKKLASRLISQGYPDVTILGGAGAAGGLGGGAVAFLNAQMQSGIETFLEITELEKAIKTCDLIITGEGKLDSQTLEGKVISGVTYLAKKYNKKVIAVCGDADAAVRDSLRLAKVYTVRSRTNSLEEAMREASLKLVEIGQDIAREVIR